MNFTDLFWVNLPDRGGREQSGRRPAVIWQDTTIFAFPTVVIIPLTTQMATLRFPMTSLIQPTARNGLSSPSVALVFQVGACDVRRFEGRIGELDDPDLQNLQILAKQLQHLP